MGFEYAFENIEEAVEVILKKYNTQHKTKEMLVFEANELKKLAYNKTSQVGNINAQKLDKLYHAYRVLGLVNCDVNFNHIIYNDLSLESKLTKEEVNYLKNKLSIPMCINPKIAPLESLDSNGAFVGIVADYFNFFKKTLSIQFNPVKSYSLADSINLLKEKKCDIWALATDEPQMAEHLNFTTHYLKAPLALVTKLSVPFINNIDELKGKSVEIVKRYALTELFRKKYPYIKIVEIANIKEGLQKVNDDKLFAVVDILPVLSYQIQLENRNSLKISGKLDDEKEFAVGVRNDDKILLQIMQKAVSKLTEEQHNEILSKWTTVQKETVIDYSLAKKLALFLLPALVISIFWNRKISSKNTLLKKAQSQIEKKNKELQRLSTTDNLTQIYNRAKLDEIIKTEINKAKNDNRESFSLALLDIDFFKKINDTYGHQTGDKVLVELAKLLKANIRENDHVGRWGGEEFLIICPNISHIDLLQLIERVKSTIKSYDFDEVGKLTVSFGLTTYKANDTINTVIKRADEALYEVKQSTRDGIAYRF